MIHITGTYVGAEKTIDGDTCIMISASDERKIEALELLNGIEISVDIEKLYGKRSNKANRYLWEMCDLIAKKLNSDKDTIYLMKLKDYGVFDDYEIPLNAVDVFSKNFKTHEILYSFTASSFDNVLEMVGIRCWRGSHTYNTKEMAEMLDGIKADASDLGIDTWTDDEIAHALSIWKPREE